jgi:hypothetical protein
VAGFSSLTGGGGLSASASSSAKSGDVGSSVGIDIGGINTGSQSSAPSWFYAAALGLAALIFLRKGR